jgi:uncharacterized protein
MFEFDPVKSDANLAKHGIDFVTAQGLWLEKVSVVLPTPYPLERRQTLTAKHDGKLWTAVFTVRGDRVRIISVRRARRNEEADYEQAKR